MDILNLPSISIRSHFLPRAPLIALGSSSPNRLKDKKPFIFTVLHEYLHFEDCTYWPITVMKYMRDTIRAAHTLHICLNPDSKIKTRNPDESLYIPFHTQAVLGDNCEVHVERIGLDALLEASAILNYRVKPKIIIHFSSNLSD